MNTAGQLYWERGLQKYKQDESGGKKATNKRARGKKTVIIVQ